MGKPTAPVEVLDLTDSPNQPEMMSAGWEWNLYLRPGPENSDGHYELKTTDVCTSKFANTLLDSDKVFYLEILEAVITPTRLSGTGNALSRDPDAINRRDVLCPFFMDWPSDTRKGQWVCADPDNCEGQHECKGGRDCDAEVCHLLHPATKSRWVVVANKIERWVVAMSLDEALRYTKAQGR